MKATERPFFVLRCELFTDWEWFHWLLSNSACVFCPKYWTELEFRSNYMVQSAHHPQMHIGLHHSIAQVHIACNHSLSSSTFIFSALHGRVILCHTEKSPHYWQSSFQRTSLINRKFALFSSSNNMMLEAVAHRILHVGCACINCFPWRTLPKTTYAIWIWF